MVGLLFSGASLPLLYMFHDVLSLALPVASLIAGELGTLLRFVANDRWVFGNAVPTWPRLWRYHAAVASSFAIWWVVTNVLPDHGIPYLLASLAGTACSVGWSMVTNFLWIWRTRSVSSSTT